MTKKLEDLLNIDHEDEGVKKELMIVDNNDALSDLSDLDSKVMELSDVDQHSQEMEQISNKALENHDELMDMGRNADPKDAARLFEVSATMLKIAHDALSNKTKARLKAAELLTKKKVADQAKELEEADVIENVQHDEKPVLTGDRNDVLKKLKDGEIT